MVYAGASVEEALIERLVACGGIRMKAHNPYRDRFGVTVADPDGYRLVLRERARM